MNITGESMENEENGQDLNVTKVTESVETGQDLKNAKVSSFDASNLDMSSFFTMPKKRDEPLIKSMVYSPFLNTNINLSSEFVSSKTLVDNFDSDETVNIEDGEMESLKTKDLIEKDVNYYNEENTTGSHTTNDDQTVPNTQFLTQDGFSAAKASQFFDIVSNFQIESVEIDYDEESITEFQETAVPKPNFNNPVGGTPHDHTDGYLSNYSNNHGRLSMSNDELNNISVKIFTDEKGVLSDFYSTGEQASKKIKIDSHPNNTPYSEDVNKVIDVDQGIQNVCDNQMEEEENNVQSTREDNVSRGNVNNSQKFYI